MAITAANKVAINGGGSSLASGSWTPAANKLYLATVVSRFSSSPNLPTLSGTTGLTWVQVATRLDATNFRRITVFRAMKSSGLSAGTTTADFAGQAQTRVLLSIEEFDGVDTSGTDGSGAIVQSPQNGNTGGATSASITMAAFADATNNAAFAAFTHANAEVTTNEAGWTELSDQIGSNSTCLETEWRLGQDLTATVSWSGGSAAWIGIAVEVAHLAAVDQTINVGRATETDSARPIEFFTYSDDAPIGIQMGFGYGPGDSAPVWQDVAESVRSVTYKRGRQQKQNQIEAGEGTLVLDDRDAAFNPDNTQSPYYPHIDALVPVRAYRVVSGTPRMLFRHLVESWPRTSRTGDVYAERTLKTVDGFETLNAAGLGGQSFAEELTGTRVNNVLDFVGWPADKRNIDVGRHTEPAVDFADDDETKALKHLQDVATDENGYLFVDAEGTLVFIGRGIAAPASSATFSDDPDVAPLPDFPATSVLDDCSRADENPLSHGGDWTASGWTQNWNAALVGGLIVEDPAHVSGYAPYWNTTFAADQEVYATIGADTSNFGWEFGLALRLQGVGWGTTNGYYVKFDLEHSGAVIYRIEAADRNAELLATVSLGAGLQIGDTVGARIVGTTIYVFLNGTTVGTYDTAHDATKITGTGKIGLWGTGSKGFASFGGGDVPVDAGARYKYVASTPSFDVDLVVNDWRVTRDGGTTQQSEDAASIASYMRRSKTLTIRAISDADALAAGQFYLAQYKNPIQKIDQITIKPGIDEALWEILLALDIGDSITVEETPPGMSSTVVGTYQIQGLTVTISPGPLLGSTFTFDLWPTEVNSVFILDDSVSGVLDTSRIGF